MGAGTRANHGIAPGAAMRRRIYLISSPAPQGGGVTHVDPSGIPARATEAPPARSDPSAAATPHAPRTAAAPRARAA